MLKVFTSTNFEGHYPVGAAAVVMAEDAESAKTLLAAELKRRGLPGDDFTVEALNGDTAHAVVLVDGDY